MTKQKMDIRIWESIGKCTRTNDDSITYQILFVLLHEYSHGLFLKMKSAKTPISIK